MKYFIAVCKITREPYVKYHIDTRIKVMNMHSYFGKVFVPCYNSNILYPGYIFVEMDHSSELAYHLVDRTPGVINILGDHQFISKHEMNKVEEAMKFQSESKLVSFEQGDEVLISDGSLKDIKGIVVNSYGSKIVVTVDIFGRPTVVTTDVDKVIKLKG